MICKAVNLLAVFALTILPVSKPCLCSGTLTLLCRCDAPVSGEAKTDDLEPGAASCCCGADSASEQNAGKVEGKRHSQRPKCPDSHHHHFKSLTLPDTVIARAAFLEVDDSGSAPTIPVFASWFPAMTRAFKEPLPPSLHQPPPPLCLLVASTQRLLI